MIARRSHGDDLVTRKFGELDSELTDSGTSSVDEDPRFVRPFCRVEALSESQFLNSVQGLEGRIETSGYIRDLVWEDDRMESERPTEYQRLQPAQMRMFLRESSRRGRRTS